MGGGYPWAVSQRQCWEGSPPGSHKRIVSCPIAGCAGEERCWRGGVQVGKEKKKKKKGGGFVPVGSGQKQGLIGYERQKPIAINFGVAHLFYARWERG